VLELSLRLQPDDDAGSTASARSNVSASAAAPSPAIQASVGGGDMMSEMAKRLRDRKAKAEMNAQVSVWHGHFLSSGD